MATAAQAQTTILFPTELIDIDEDRQRKDLGDLQPLADAISVRGLINAICIHEPGPDGRAKLVAGERRLRAIRDLLKWPQIEAKIYERLSRVEAELIELQENIQRRNLTWQEEALATERYHDLKSQELQQAVKGLRDPIPWTALGTANDLGKSEKHVRAIFRVAASLRQQDAEIMGATTLRGAINLLASRAERARAAATVRGLAIVGAPMLPPIVSAGASREENTKRALEAMFAPQPEEIADAPDLEDTTALEAALATAMEEERSDPFILAGDFLEWADAYAGPKFDLLHIDFPYGKGYAGSRTRRTGKATFAPRYADNPEVFWNLLAGFLDLQDNLAFPVAHALFWYDMPFYQPIIDLFAEAGWELVAPYPLVWTKGYLGVASDPDMRPRHCYETALLFQRGGRKLVRLDKDHFEYASRDPNKLHLNQKAYPMLRHFLSMLVDGNTAVLDPTCGSAMALRAAKDLGSPRVFGVELDASSAEMARYTMIKPEEELTND